MVPNLANYAIFVIFGGHHCLYGCHGNWGLAEIFSICLLSKTHSMAWAKTIALAMQF